MHRRISTDSAGFNRALLSEQIFAGDSAGGGLAVATMMYLRDEGYPLPSGAFLMSPWVDLTM